MDSEDIVKFIRGKSDDLECANAEIKQLRQRVKALEGELLSAAMESTQTAQVEKLEQLVAELESKWLSPETYKILMQERSETLKDLAASQLQNNKFMEALSEWRQDHWPDGHLVDFIDSLPTSTDTEALEKYLMERLGEPVAWYSSYLNDVELDSTIANYYKENRVPLYSLKGKP